ncbi:MAG: PQQ-binding-like beta-propeller repeat protein, partial [Myxococcales bacterium]|nr:PQQ-binding-like beta-propeller repeat protein [Myxococcales bacterium]
ERLMIDASMGPPAVVTIGGEPAVVARTRTPLDGDQLYVEAFGARTGERLWRLGPLGDFAQGYRATHFAAAGGRLIVSDAQSKLRVLDLATGAEQQQLNLTDRVEQMCDAPGEAGERVWFAQVDERSFYFDPQGGALTEAKERPEGCPKHAFRERPETGRVDERGRKAPKAEGTKIEKLFEVDALGVAVGVKSPGTAIPRAVGYAPSSREVAWVEAIPAVDPATYREGSNELAGLAGGRLVALYGEGTKLWRVTALDASTGTRLWDVALRSIFAVDHISGLTVTDDLIYVVRMSSVDVLDAATGARVTTIGDETYEG